MAQTNNLYYLWIWVSKFEDFALLIQSSPLAKLLLKAARPLCCVPTVFPYTLKLLHTGEREEERGFYPFTEVGQSNCC